MKTYQGIIDCGVSMTQWCNHLPSDRIQHPLFSVTTLLNTPLTREKGLNAASNVLKLRG